MKNNESGEFELVLGNKQLLSGFFIVVILFGVFFTMGYIVGRNSAPSQRMAEGQSLPAVQAARPNPAFGGAAQPVDGQRGGDAQVSGTQPVREPETAAAAPPPEAAAPASEPPVEAGSQPRGLIEPVPGEMYLQVYAGRQPVADVMVRTLRDKGFRAGLSQGPNDLLRVLVGPFPDTASLGRAKAGLEDAGLQPIVRK
jgi:cell division septation protein DedD